MDDKKKQELESMYALRAGLSFISQRYDELMANNAQLSKKYNELTYFRKEPYKGLKNSDVDSEIAAFDNNAEVIVSSSTQVVLHLCEKLKDESKLFFYFVRKCVPNIVDFFQETPDKITTDYSSSLYFILVTLGYIFVAPISIPIIIFDIIAFPFILLNPTRLEGRKILKAIKKDKQYNYVKEWGKNHPNDSTCIYQETIDSLVEMLEDSEYKFTNIDRKLINKYKSFSPTAIVQLQNYFERARKIKKQIGYKKVEIQKEEYQTQCKEFDKRQSEKQAQYDDLVQRNKQLSLMISTESQTITNVLKQSYSSILDIRDWENLDLIIFNYETGRADSIKEALQLVDMERRNNNLINCIKQASQEICSSIRENFKDLGEAMLSGFYSLSSQIEASRTQTINAISGLKNNVSDAFSEISIDIKNSVGQQELSNALLEKANLSSKEMVEQMKKLNEKIKK